MITVLTGDNLYELNRQLHKRVESFVSEYGDLAVEKVDGEEATYDAMLGAIESQPFLAARKLVVLRRPSVNKQFTENIEYVAERCAESNEVIIFEPKLDKRTSYYKQLKKLGNFNEYSQSDTRDLPSWIAQYVKHEGGMISFTDARYLVDRVGPNQQLLARELDKLMVYDPQITRQSIELLCEPTPQSTIFQLLDAAFAGDAKRAIALYEDQRRQRVEPLAIIGMVTWQLHLLSVVKAARDQDSNLIAKDAKASPYVIQKTKRIADGLTLAQVRSLVTQVADADEKMKTTAVDADMVMTGLIIRIAQMI